MFLTILKYIYISLYQFDLSPSVFPIIVSSILRVAVKYQHNYN